MVPETKGKASEERRNGRGRRGNIPLDQPENDNANENGIGTIPSSQQPPAPTAGSALEVHHPPTTKAGKPRQRMQWTEDLNTDLMRCYYRVTEGETISVGIRPILRQAFSEMHPELSHITEQRLMDQKRVIVNNKRLPKEQLDRLKMEATINLGPGENLHGTATDALGRQRSRTPSPIADTNTQEAMEEENDKLFTEVSSAFCRALTEFEGMDPTMRPKIPKQRSSRKLAIILNFLDTQILPNHLADHASFEDLHTAIYVAAVAAIRCNGSSVRAEPYCTERKPNPVKPWEMRLIKKIATLRKEIGQITAYKNGQRSNRLQRKVENIIRVCKFHAKNNPLNITTDQVLDTLKQRLAAISKRLRRYQMSNLRKRSNRLFTSNEKQFYRSLGNDQLSSKNKPPTKQETEQFWSDIWSAPKQHNTKAVWIKRVEDSTTRLPSMAEIIISSEEATAVINKTHNWKAAGCDRIQNFWYKKLKCTHLRIGQHFNEFLQDPSLVPKFLTQGITYLLPKNNDTQNPSKYRPITCLPTVYKLLTACIANKIYQHCESEKIIAMEQKGCIKKSQGCKEQLLIDSIILEQAIQKQRNIYTAFIDYKKAFDSVPHTWLIKVLQLYKISPLIVQLLQHLMGRWETRLNLVHEEGCITTGPIQIRRGIFQGDALSPLWFCMAINPLSYLLNSSTMGFVLKGNREVQHKISHLLYMDDIKLYASTSTQIHSLLKTTEMFSGDICMEFGLDKCRTQTVLRGSHSALGFQLESGERIEAMDPGETYKYLGLQQATRTQHSTIKEQITMKYKTRLKYILKTHLNGKNMIKALNTYALPVLTYTFGIIKWTKTDIEKIERTTRTTMTKYRIHHPKSARERVTLPRSQGGRGVLDLDLMLHNQISNLQNYFNQRADDHPLYRTALLADMKYTPLNLSKQSVRELDKLEHTKHLINTWKQKALHGRHPHELSSENIDLTASNYWLTHGDLFPETEGFLCAIQDQVVPTRNYLKHVIKDKTVQEDKCRKCLQQAETITHITAGCTSLSHTEYLHRHNCVGKILHQKLAQKLKLIQTSVPYYHYNPERILEDDNHRLYWDRSVITDRTIPANRPDIIWVNKEQKQTWLIDVAVPNTNNIQDTVTTKLSKYADLAYEIKKSWRQENVRIVPIVISATGVIPKTLIPNLTSLGLHPTIAIIIQKSVIISTCNIVRKFLNMQ